MNGSVSSVFSGLLTRVFGSKHDRDIKTIMPLVEEINDIFAGLASLSDDELRAKTDEFRNRLTEGETTDDIMCEAFAVVKETCRRLVGKTWMVMGRETVWDMVPFDCQLIGAIVLQQGNIAEMATGEGKSLVSTMPIYLNALTGRGVHFITVNDYLVQRDVEWYGKIYEFLDVSVGCIIHDMSHEKRQEAYNADITYGTNNEFGFDYLRDNMAIRPEDVVQRGFNYALVDEVDSVLIDEARTPLIISGAVGSSTHRYGEIRPLVQNLVSQQGRMVNTMIANAERLLVEDKSYEACTLLLQASRGAPKNKRLMKLFSDRPELKKHVNTVENDYLRDKRLNDIDEELLFVIDERNHTIHFTDLALNTMPEQDRDNFLLPDLNEALSEIEHDPALTAEEKTLKQDEVTLEFAVKSEKIHNANQLLRAYTLFEKDQQYVVQDGKVLIVDEFTGRIMSGRRYSDGLHQALEAKENVHIEQETQTLATITLQNYFRMYDKLAGMTGTAETEAHEFWEIYKLDVVVIPTNKPIIRLDNDDLIYKTRREKYNAIIEHIKFLHELGRPVLVGTVSVDVSETLARMLKRMGIPHNVLNAKQHQREADIVAGAGNAGAVTIATNMAGRGTDIKLDPAIRAVPIDDEDAPGGLHIIGTERHEARRIDRQLRGRSGRQGDPGSTVFYLSLEDDLMRLFGSERIAGIMERLGIQEGEVITHSMVTGAINRAQKRVEEQNFAIRKHLLEYDDVMNTQRQVIYELRNAALRSTNVRDRIFEMMERIIDDLVDTYTEDRGAPVDWDMDDLAKEYTATFFTTFSLNEDQTLTFTQEALLDHLNEVAKRSYEQRAALIETDILSWNERVILLSTIDDIWKEHLHEMDNLKEGIGLRGYGQRDPLVEYKKEGYDLFESTVQQINSMTVKTLLRGMTSHIIQKEERRKPVVTNVSTSHSSYNAYSGKSPEEAAPEKAPTVVRTDKKVGRNDPCPCGSGKKYKVCCGR